MTASPDFVVAIPARHAATRLPGKPLRLLGGEPLVLHVARRALDAGARQVWLATDDIRVAEALAGVDGVRVAMTSAEHASGTDRLAECAAIAGWAPDTVVVNLQGDEPLASGDALYFSRAPLPWPRDAFAGDRSVLPAGGHWLRHIGIYAYRAGFLQAFARMPPGTLERIESLEQLRVLEAGHRIAVALAPEPFPPGVDTPEDLERAQARLDGGNR